MGQVQPDLERPIFSIAMVGYGNVARAFVRLLLFKGRELPFDCRITGVATRNFRLEDPDGLNLKHLLTSIPEALEPQSEGDIIDFINNCPADAILELTTLNPLTGQPAGRYIEAALYAHRHVITCNKGPVANSNLYYRLRELSRRRGVAFRFEGAVLDGLPVFNLLEKTLLLNRVRGFSGILNGTTNFILEELAAGRSYEEALAAAQVLGVVEADPMHDLLGWDAAAKVSALANVLMEADITPAMVKRQDITLENLPEMVADAKEKGKVLKQVARAEWVTGEDDEELEACVSLEQLEPGDFLAAMFGTGGIITLNTDLMGRITLVEHGAEVNQTAYAILSDLLAITSSYPVE